MDELERYLSRIKTITGSLKISRSFPIISLDFFKKLEKIQGIHTADSMNTNHYSLEILENENLQQLFPSTSKVAISLQNGRNGQREQGRAFIHYNPKLCRNVIRRTLKKCDMVDPGDRSPDISYATNGGTTVCSEKELQLTVQTKSSALYLQFDNYQKEIIASHPNNIDLRALLGYEIHYRQIDKSTFSARNLTKFGGRDACGGDEWKIQDHQPTKGTHDDNGRENWPKETTFVTDGIKPYTYYAVFVTTLIIREGVQGGESIEGAQSEVVYVLTPEDIPSKPEDILVTPISYSSVNISWTAPLDPNGIIDHYLIEVELQKVDTTRLLDVKLYCKNGVRTAQPQQNMENLPSGPAVITDQDKGESSKDQVAPDGQCDCSTCPKDGGKSPVQEPNNLNKQARLEEAHFENEVINVVFTPSLSFFQGGSRNFFYYIKRNNFFNKFFLKNSFFLGGSRKKRSTVNGNSTSNQIEIEDTISTLFPPTSEDDMHNVEDQELLPVPEEKNSIVYNKTVSGQYTQLMIENLTHFSKYTVKVTACHHEYINDKNEKLRRCSETSSKDFRTQHKHGADKIVGDVVDVFDKNNGTDVWITWKEPKDPNMLIIYYDLQIRKHLTSLKHVETCVAAKEFIENNRYVS